MQIRKADFLSEAQRAGISSEKAESMWNALESRGKSEVPQSRFDFSNVLYYLGSFIVLAAMGWFLSEMWDKFGSTGVLAIALGYIILFLLMGNFLWKRDSTKVPGGLFIVLAVSLVPLVVYALQQLSGLWDFPKYEEAIWLPMEVVTVVCGLVALYFYRFPFLTAPIFFALWMMALSVASLIFGSSALHADSRLWVSVCFGAIILVMAYLIDRRTKGDYAFWGYLFGLCAFWFSLTWMEFTSPRDGLIYCLINVGLIILSVLLDRGVFLVFGSIGIFIYLNFIFFDFFQNTLLFPIVLSLIGIAIVFFGIIFHRYHKKWRESLLSYLPQSLVNLLPSSRRHK